MYIPNNNNAVINGNIIKIHDITSNPLLHNQFSKRVTKGIIIIGAIKRLTSILFTNDVINPIPAKIK